VSNGFLLQARSGRASVRALLHEYDGAFAEASVGCGERRELHRSRYSQKATQPHRQRVERFARFGRALGTLRAQRSLLAPMVSPWGPCSRLFRGTGILPVYEEMTGGRLVPPIQPERRRWLTQTASSGKPDRNEEMAYKGVARPGYVVRCCG